MAANMKTAFFWIVAPCSMFAAVLQVLCTSGLMALMMEVQSTSKTLVNFYQAARRYKPEQSHI
jgi:hypothetical protein